MVSSNDPDTQPEAGLNNDPENKQPEPELEAGPRAQRPNFLTATRFSDFDLPPEIMEGLDKAGFDYCTPIQAQAIPVAMAGHDIAGQAQTGTGKTTAFLVPLLNRLLKNKPLEPGVPRALIVTPTRELALQIHEDALVLAGATELRQVLVIGGMDYKEQADLLRAAPEIVICTPGRIIDYLQQGVFKTKGIEVAVVDEADRLLDMGFIKDLKYLLGKLPPFTARQTMLFSATLDDRVMELTYQFMNPPQYITAEPDKSTKVSIEQELYHIGRDEKLSLLIGLLRREEHRRVIIFANTKSGVEWLAKKLTMNGFQAEGITGDLPQPKRLKLMEAFKENRLQILVATDVASRGIHVDDVSHVYNYDLPQDAENYIHRIGRTARAGHSGKAVSFGCEDYVFHLEAIENLLGEKIPVFWADQDWFQEDQGGEVKLKDRRGGDRRKPERRGGREGGGSGGSGGAGRSSRSPAKSQRPGGIFGLAPRSSGEGLDDPRQILSWKLGSEEPPVLEGELVETEAGENAAPEREAREGRRRKRRRGRRGRGESPAEAIAVLSGEAGENTAASSGEASAQPAGPLKTVEAESESAALAKPKATGGRSRQASSVGKQKPLAAESRAASSAVPETIQTSAEKAKAEPEKAGRGRKKAVADRAESPAKAVASEASAKEAAKKPSGRVGSRKKTAESPVAEAPSAAESARAETPKSGRSSSRKSPASEEVKAVAAKAPAKKAAAGKEAPAKEKAAAAEAKKPAARVKKESAEKTAKTVARKTVARKSVEPKETAGKKPEKKAAPEKAPVEAKKTARAKKEETTAPKKTVKKAESESVAAKKGKAVKKSSEPQKTGTSKKTKSA